MGLDASDRESRWKLSRNESNQSCSRRRLHGERRERNNWVFSGENRAATQHNAIGPLLLLIAGEFGRVFLGDSNKSEERIQ